MAQIALNYSAAQINAAIAKITTLVSVIEGNIVQLYDDTTTAIYPRTKAEAVFFNNDTSKTLDQQFSQLKEGVNDKVTELEQGVEEDINNLTEQVEEKYGKYISNEEYIRAYTDAEDNFLWGIKLDGSIEFAKGIPTPIRNYIESIDRENDEEIERINQLISDLSVDVDILTNTYHYVSNEEYIMAIIDANDNILLGFKRDGNIHIPNKELLSITNNNEYLKVIIDKNGNILWGIHKDGSVYIPKGVPEEVKPILKTFVEINNLEYLSITIDADGNIISSISPDGKKHFPKQALFDKISDKEDRLELTTDANGKILSYRDKDGTKFENDLKSKNFSSEQMVFNDENARAMRDALQGIGFKADMPNDFSKSQFVELPIPRVCASVRLLVPRMPTNKTADIEGYLEYYDKDGNYFNKPILLNSQGSSSMHYIQPDGSQGNLSVDFTDCKIKFGNWVSQDSFHVKKYYIDAFRGQCIVGYHLMEQVYQTRPYGQKKPYDTIIENNSITDSLGKFKKDYNTGALCHPDGFPVVIYVNTGGEDIFYGVYAWCLKKHRDNYYCDKSNPDNIILDGEIGASTLFGGNVQWNKFEIRNPKDLIDINGNEYDGDSPKELSDTDELSKSVKDNIERLSGSLAALSANSSKITFEQYFLPDAFIDWFLVSQVTYNIDGFYKNWIWCTWDGQRWTPTLYDVDSIFGMMPIGTYVNDSSAQSHIITESVTSYLVNLYPTEIRERYRELRDKGIFDANNITSLLTSWIDKIGYQNLKDDLDKFNQTPSYRESYLNAENWRIDSYSWNTSNHDYDNNKIYNVGDTCYYYGYQMQAIAESIDIPPFSQVYDKHPQASGFYNSPSRVFNWLVLRINYLDSVYN